MFYAAYGLRIQSSFELYGFERVDKNEPDLTITYKFVSKPVVHCLERVQERRIHEGIEFVCPFNVSYEITNGNQILLVSLPKEHGQIEMLPLYGFAMATLLHQRGIFVLHASSVAVGEKGVVIVGEKGTGKTTLAMSLIARGNQLLSDDVTGLIVSQSKLEILPGGASIKLWPDTMLALGMDANGYPRLHSQTEKRHFLSSEKGLSNKITKLRIIIVLCHGDTLTIEELSGRMKILFLLGNHYLSRYENALLKDEKEKIFSECVKIAQRTRIIKLSRPKNISLLQDTAKLVETILTPSS